MIIYHHHYFLNKSSNFSNFWGAFFGAFFPFVFGLVAYIITKRRERFVLHKNTLVKMDRALNKLLYDLDALKKILQDSMRIVGLNHVTSNRLFNLELPENVEIDLGDIDLINNFFSYRMSINTLNFNLATINHALANIEDLFIHGQAVHDDNFSFVGDTLKKLLDELPELDNQTIKLLALVRIHQNMIKGKIPFVYGVLKTQWEQDVSQEKINTEIKEINKEIVSNKVHFN